MTWTLTIQMMVFVAVISIGGLGYFAWAARDLDRRYGKPRRADPAE